MMDFDKTAREIAAVANECCYRSDGYEEKIQTMVAAALKAAWNDALEDVAVQSCDGCALGWALKGDWHYEGRGEHRAWICESIWVRAKKVP